MRLLHAGHPDDAHRVPARQSGPDRTRGADRHFRQSVPLHRLSEYRHRDTRRGEAAAGAAAAIGLIFPPWPTWFGHPTHFATDEPAHDDGKMVSRSWPSDSTISATASKPFASAPG